MTMRILVPVDGSASSRAAVRFLAGRETMLGQNPEIELLTVQNVVPQRLVEMLSLESLESYYRTEGERGFESAPRAFRRRRSSAAASPAR